MLEPGEIGNFVGFAVRALSACERRPGVDPLVAWACTELLLTPREAGVLCAVLHGLDREDAARWLGMSLSTLKTHVGSILRKSRQPTMRALARHLSAELASSRPRGGAR